MSDTHDTPPPVAIERAEPVHPLVQAAIDRGATAAELRDFLALQREWREDQARQAYAAALVRLRADLPTVIDRDTTVDYEGGRGGRVHYSHTSLAAAMAVITPALARHGFSISWRPATVDGRVSVTCRLTHSAGHYEETTIAAPPDGSGAKSAAQGVASTITLLSRYSALAMLGIATADMREAPAPREREPDEVNPARNMRAAEWVQKQGRALAEAVLHLGGRGVAEWTSADLAELRTWVGGAP